MSSASSSTGFEHLSPEQAAAVDAACDAFERAWKAVPAGGDVPDIVVFLENRADPIRRILVRELVAIDEECRRKFGVAADPERDQRFRAMAPASEPTERERPAACNGPEAQTDWPVLPGFELLEIVGSGGMGVVYKARQRTLNRIVAIKMLRHTGLRGAGHRERFQREALAVARLQHPNLVQVYEFGEVRHAGAAGAPYLVLEYVGGGSLAARLGGKPLRPIEAAKLVELLARAIEYAHAQGIIHRDLKPGNVLLGSDTSSKDSSAKFAGASSSHSSPQASIPKLTDFGLARIEASQDLTQTGDILGTPSYMAPEQTTGKTANITVATDVYGLGAILYECLTGRPPFRAETALATLAQVHGEDPVPVRRLQPTVGRDLETICLKCLHKEPGKRYGSALELAEDLQRFLEHRPITARPTGLVSGILRRARRRPVVAALIASLLAVTLSGVAGIAWAWRRAEASRKEEQAARKAAESSSYFDRIARASQSYWWSTGERTEYLLDECQRLTPELCGWEYRYLRRLYNEPLNTIEAHRDSIADAVYSSDGKYLATCTGRWGDPKPGEVKVWDAVTYESKNTFLGHERAVYTVAFQPNGPLLASAGADRRIFVWNLERPDDEVFFSAVAVAFKLVFTVDGRRLIAACADGTVRIWDPVTQVLERTLMAHPGQNTFAVDVSRDGRYLASAGRDGRVCVWDLTSGAPPVRFSHGLDIRRVAFSPDGQILASGTFDGILCFWNLHQDNPQPRTASMHSWNLAGFAFHPDGRSLAVSTAYDVVHTFTVRGEQTLLRGQGSSVTCLAFSPDGRRLVSGGGMGHLRVWDLTAHVGPTVTQGGSGVITAIAVSPDGQRLVTAGTRDANNRRGTNDAWILDLKSGAKPRVLEGHASGLTSVAYHPAGRQVTTGSADRTARIWDVETGAVLHVLEGHTDGVTGVAYDPSGQYVITASSDRSLRVWSASEGTLIRQLNGHEGPVLAVAAARETYVVSGSVDRTVRVWDLVTGSEIQKLEGHAGPVTTVCYSGATDLIASAEDDTVRLWRLSTGPAPAYRVIQLSPIAPPLDIEPRTSNYGPTRLAFSPDGRRLATAHAARPMQLWDTETGAEALLVPGNPRNSAEVAFSPTDDRLYSVIVNTVLTWDTQIQRPARIAPDISWHEAQADQAESDGDDHAVAFHSSEILKHHPNDATTHVRRGVAYAGLGREEDALADLRRAEELGADRSVLALRRADAYIALGQLDKALEVAQEVVAQEPENVGHWTRVTATLLEQGRIEEARSASVRMLRHFQSLQKEPPLRAFWLLAPLGDFPSEVPLDQWIDTFSTQGPGSLRALGATEYRARRYEEAVESLRQACTRTEPRAWELLFLAMACQQKGLTDEARDALALARAWIRDADQAEDPRIRPRFRWFHWLERAEVRALLREAESLISTGDRL